MSTAAKGKDVVPADACTSCLQMLQQGFEANAGDYDGRQAQLRSAVLQPLHLHGRRLCLPGCTADELDPAARLPVCHLFKATFACCLMPLPGISMDCVAGQHIGSFHLPIGTA